LLRPIGEIVRGAPGLDPSERHSLAPPLVRPVSLTVSLAKAADSLTIRPMESNPNVAGQFSSSATAPRPSLSAIIASTLASPITALVALKNAAQKCSASSANESSMSGMSTVLVRLPSRKARSTTTQRARAGANGRSSDLRCRRGLWHSR
jgi:hypothetical protein